MTEKDMTSVQQQPFPWPTVEGIDPGENLLTTQEVATYLRITSQTLAKWRRDGEGPPFIRLGGGPRGRIRFRWVDLMDWLDAHGNDGSSQRTGSPIPREQKSKGVD